ncbi:MAG: urate hydroxylase PuuD [Alphaproteobacteria bacterium]|nr:urate hydroxylase PuuD [Alphaproteobacteria bacterium]
MEIDFSSWLGLALRWVHLITGIAWIGSSFYFIWLDNSLKPPADPKDKKDGVGGELWAVHGGGFYHKKKYQVAPDHMPDDLHWFKWEAYATWISGFLLLCLVYYYGAGIYLIDRAKLDLHPVDATLIGLGFIVGSWIGYNALCKSPLGKDNRIFGFVWFALMTAATYVLCQIFSGRGAFIHAGAMIGTVMAANVFMVIIPNQKKTVAALLKGEKPDPALGKTAKQRSLHNNYMTLPVLLIMISNHYPMLYAVPANWAILAGLCAAAWPIREFFNQKHKGNTDHRYLVAGAAGFVLVMLAASWLQTQARLERLANVGKVDDAAVMEIVKTHCTACHAKTPSHESVDTAPLDVVLETLKDLRQHAVRVKAQTVDADTMPLGNETGMTAEERALLGAWLEQQKK